MAAALLGVRLQILDIGSIVSTVPFRAPSFAIVIGMLKTSA
jgi:hypothetical protein